nr:endo alpha-1,4 polygalactosaminidase [uncultured Ralstonia sp.]
MNPAATLSTRFAANLPGRRATRMALVTLLLCGLMAGCGGGGDGAGNNAASSAPAAQPATPGSVAVQSPAFSASPWMTYYGSAQSMGSLATAAATFRVMDIDLDPGMGNFSTTDVASLKNGGGNIVLSYLNLGACENYRSYWNTVPAGFKSCAENTAAQAGSYAGYPQETWMNPSNPDYQHLILDYVAPRLVAQGADGFYLDNLEIVEHGTSTTNGPCDAACAQGGLDLVRKLREKYPKLVIVMQNAASDVTRLGVTGGVPFPSLLDGIAHEEVYAPVYNASTEAQLLTWKSMALTPNGHAFWIATLDYVGSCGATSSAQAAYTRSRSNGFVPYVSDTSAGQKVLCYWNI